MLPPSYSLSLSTISCSTFRTVPIIGSEDECFIPWGGGGRDGGGGVLRLEMLLWTKRAGRIFPKCDIRILKDGKVF